MNIGSTFAAPPHVSLPRTALPHHAGSLLNPFGFLRGSAQSLKTTPRPPPSPPKPILPTSSFSSKRYTVLLPSPLPTPAKTPTPLTPPPSTAAAYSAPSTCLSSAPPPASSPIRCPPGASPASTASSPTPPAPHLAPTSPPVGATTTEAPTGLASLTPSTRISAASSSAMATSSRPPTMPSTPTPPPQSMHHATLPYLTAPTTSPAPSSPPPLWRSPAISTALSPLDDPALHVGRAMLARLGRAVPSQRTKIFEPGMAQYCSSTGTCQSWPISCRVMGDMVRCPPLIIWS